MGEGHPDHPPFLHRLRSTHTKPSKDSTGAPDFKFRSAAGLFATTMGERLFLPLSWYRRGNQGPEGHTMCEDGAVLSFSTEEFYFPECFLPTLPALL